MYRRAREGQLSIRACDVTKFVFILLQTQQYLDCNILEESEVHTVAVPCSPLTANRCSLHLQAWYETSIKQVQADDGGTVPIQSVCLLSTDYKVGKFMYHQRNLYCVYLLIHLFIVYTTCFG
jgi:hypothetical protein